MQTFKSALHDNVFGGKVPAKALADKIGKSYTYLANAANESQEESHFQARDVIPLTLGSGSFALLDFIERSCGRVAFVVPYIGGSTSKVVNETSNITAEFSDLMRELSVALDERGEDGQQVSQKEAARICRVGEELIKGVCRLIEAAKSEARRERS